ncbi:MAG: phage holin family protein [Verrucomicrobia bacterium]|nr:phage holin family protein [Verrucomicrobiota bacterium]
MSEGTETKPGVCVSLKRILDTLLASAQNRVELFAVELQEEKCRVVEAILCAAAVAAFGMMTITLGTFTVVILFWEHGRLVALAILSAVYLVGTVLAWRALQSRLKAESAFAGTVEELKKDRECLRTDN